MSSIVLSYPQVGQQPLSAQKAQEAANLARELGFGQQTELRIEAVSDVIEGLRVMLVNCDKCWQ